MNINVSASYSLEEVLIGSQRDQKVGIREKENVKLDHHSLSCWYVKVTMPFSLINLPEGKVAPRKTFQD